MHDASVQGLPARENRTEEGTPHVVKVHVEWGVLEGRREEIAAGKRWRRKVLNSFAVPSSIRS